MGVSMSSPLTKELCALIVKEGGLIYLKIHGDALNVEVEEVWLATTESEKNAKSAKDPAAKSNKRRFARHVRDLE